MERGELCYCSSFIVLISPERKLYISKHPFLNPDEDEYLEGLATHWGGREITYIAIVTWPNPWGRPSDRPYILRIRISQLCWAPKLLSIICSSVPFFRVRCFQSASHSVSQAHNRCTRHSPCIKPSSPSSSSVHRVEECYACLRANPFPFAALFVAFKHPIWSSRRDKVEAFSGTQAIPTHHATKAIPSTPTPRVSPLEGSRWRPTFETIHFCS